MAKSSFLGRWTSRLFAKQATADGKGYGLRDGDLFEMPFSKSFEVSGVAIPALAGLLDVAHLLKINGVDVEPKLIRVTATCTIADLGCAVGDIIELPCTTNDASTTSGYGILAILSTTRFKLRIGNSGFASLINGTTGAGGQVLNRLNWTLTLRAWA